MRPSTWLDWPAMALTVTQLRKTLETMDDSELRELIEALYQASSDNKRFLTAQLEADNSELLNIYVRELEKSFDPSKGELKVAAVKKSLQNYLRVASPIEATQARIRYVRAALSYWQKLPYWSENHYTTLGKMFQDIAHTALEYPERHELLASVHQLGQEFVRQERKYGYFDWHVKIYDDFRQSVRQER